MERSENAFQEDTALVRLSLIDIQRSIRMVLWPESPPRFDVERCYGADRRSGASEE